MEKKTIEVFCQVAKKISQARAFADRDAKNVLNDALETIALHCDCSVDMLFRNMVEEIFSNIEYEQKRIK